MANIGSLSVSLGLGFAGFQSGLSQAQGMLSGFAVHVKGAMASLGVAGAASIAGFATSAVSAAAEMEALELSFHGIAGGAEQAKKLVKEIVDFAAATPFDTLPLADSVKLLSTMGFEAREALGMIQKLGDVVAVSGKGSEGLNLIALALGQIRLMGRLQGQDAMQLTNAGIPIWDALAKRLGKTTAEVRKLSEQGGIDAKTAIAAVMDVADDPRFKGGQDRLSKSLSGMWSTLKDNTRLAMADLGKIIAESFDLKGTAVQITTFIAHLRTKLEGLRPILSLVGAGFGAVRDIVLTVTKDIVDSLSKWGLTIDGSKERLAEIRLTAISFFEELAKGINAMINSLKQFGGVMLEHVIAPLIDALSLVDAFKPKSKDSWMMWFASRGQTGKAAPSAAEFVNDLKKKGQELQGTSLTRGEDSITSFFDRVRQTGALDMLAGPKSIFNTLMGIGKSVLAGPAAGGPPGVSAMMNEIKRPEANVAGSTGAYSSILADIGQRGGKGNSLPEIMKDTRKATQDVAKTLGDLWNKVKNDDVVIAVAKGA